MSFRQGDHRSRKAAIYTSRNSEWVLDIVLPVTPTDIYTSRNSEWVLDGVRPVHHMEIYTSRNSEWVLDVGVKIDGAASTLVEILNEF